MKTITDDLIILIDDTMNSRKKRILKKVLVILKFVESSDTTVEQKVSFQNELVSYSFLESNEISTKQLNKQFRKLERFINTEFDYRNKGFYTAYYMSIGMVLGLSIGSAFFDPQIGLSTGMMIGVFIGMLYGRVKDQKAEKENRVYNFRP